MSISITQNPSELLKQVSYSLSNLESEVPCLLQSWCMFCPASSHN